MKFSDTIIPWKKQRIAKSPNKLSSNPSNEFSKTQKELYVQSAIRNPEFDQTISEVHQRILDHSTAKEKAAISTILEKVDSGDLEYEDLSKIETLSANNYKYLFSTSPETTPRNAMTTSILIAIVTVALLVLRVAYAFENSSTLLLFISLINLVANAYTFLNWIPEVTAIVDKWLQSNNIKTQLRDKIIGKVSKKLWILAIILLLLLIIWLIISYAWFSHYELGTDIVSIIALGVAIVNNNIIKFLATYFEKHIYYDN